MADTLPPNSPTPLTPGGLPPAAAPPAVTVGDPRDPAHVQPVTVPGSPGPVPLPPGFPPGPTPAPVLAPVGVPEPPPADGCPHPDLRPLWDALGVIEEGVTNAAIKVIASLNDVIANCQTRYNELASLITGKLEVKLDDCAEVVSKAQGKCKKQLDQALTQAYSYAVPMGLCYPTPEQVLYGLQTGRCLETLIPGWTPVGYDNISCAPDVCSTPVVNQAVNVSQPTAIQGPTLVNEPITTTNTIKSEDGKETVNVTVNVPKEPAPVVNVNVPSTAPGTLQSDPTTEAVSLLTSVKNAVEAILNQPGVIVSIPQSPGTPERTYKENIDLILNQIIGTIGTPPPPVQQPPPKDVPLQGDVYAGPQAGGLLPPDWNSIYVCASIDAYQAQFQSGTNPLAAYLEFDKSGDDYTMPAWAVPIFNALPKPLQLAFWALGRVNWLLFDGYKNFLVQNVSPKIAQMIVPVVMKVMASVVDKWVGGGLADFMKGYVYWINYLMPTNLPTTAEASSAYLNGAITDDLWRCWVRANNDLETPARIVRDAGRAKPSILEAMTLFRWGKIDQKTYDNLMLRNGVTDPTDQTFIEMAAVALPGPSELISFMVRDVGDPDVVERYQLDQDFDKKWAGELKKLGDAQGIDPDIAKYYWRAHWQYPSPEQAFRMVQRLRPGRVAENIETTADDVLKLLEINDYAPFWRERLLSISYQVLTRTDIQRAYEIDAVGIDAVKQAYLDEGYNDRDAQILADFTEKLKVRTLQQRRPPAEAGRYVGYYLSYAMTLDDLKAVLKTFIFDKVVYDKTIADAENRRALNLTQAKLKRYRLNFTKGIWDEDFTKRALLTIGLKDGDADDLLTVWKGDKPIVLKHVTAAQICKAANSGLVSREEQAVRLVNLGYSAADATILIGECRDGLTQKQQAAAAKRAKEQEAANAKVVKAAQKDLKAQINEQKKAFQNQIKDLNAQILDLNRQLAAAQGKAGPA